MQSGTGLVLFGTRPEAIKIITLVEAYRLRFGTKAIHLCCSGQHKDLIDDTIAALNFTVDVNFQLMTKGQTPAEITSRIQSRTIEEINSIKPDWILVHGDTATTLAGAMAGFYTQTPVIHLEAGLRTYNKQSPWPEEGIRQTVSRLSDFHLAPTPRAQQNLLNEKILAENIRVIGNPGADHLLQDLQPVAEEYSEENLNKQIVLVTLHRRENQGKHLSEVLRGLIKLASSGSDIEIRFILHPNPQIREQVESVLGSVEGKNAGVIKLLPPLPYNQFQDHLKVAGLIITDSGGLQEEAGLLGIPTVIARETTERPELVELGLAWMTELNAPSIVSIALEALDQKLRAEAVVAWRELQGGGTAGQRAAHAISDFFPV